MISAFLIVPWVIFHTGVVYYLARRKTKNPMISTLVGFFLSIIQPIGLIYIVVLMLKKDVNQVDTSSHDVIPNV